MSSLHDVARLAGVSKTLVSRVVNHQSGVSEKNRERILEAIKALNYKPNAMARSLVTQQTKIIGVVMDTLCEPYFFPMIQGIEEAANSSDYDLAFASGQGSITQKTHAIHFFLEGRSDGIILYGSRRDDDALIHSLAEERFPFVVVENTFDELDIENVSLDNAYGTHLIVEHLMRRGCRRIAHMSGDPIYQVSQTRQKGYLDAVEQFGLPLDQHLLIPATFDVAGSYQAMRRYLEETPREMLPDGLCCSSDNAAYGAIIALEEKGLRVPQDILVGGFDDDIPPRDYHYASLTTLAQPLPEMARSAFQLLLKRIEKPEEAFRKLVFYPRLVVRQSTMK